MTPEVSIIIPTYKRTEKLHRALQSIESACTLAYETIVVDDCPDGSAASTSLQFGAKYLCKAGRERGLSRSRNLGLKLATGKYVSFLDDDDFYIPRALDLLLSEVSKGRRFVFGNYISIKRDARILNDLGPLTFDHLLICNHIPVGAYMIERSLISHAFDERMRSHEDWDFLLQHIDSEKFFHVPHEIVMIDKTENLESSMQARRRKYFWLDFLSLYSRYPAPHLNQHRHEMLLTLGINIDADMLGHLDII